jgi:hypothetical protein
MRLFGQEGLGRPDVEAQAEVEALRKTLARQLPDHEIPEIQAALVFTTEGVQIEAEDAPIRALPLKKLKDFMRRQAREHPLNARQIETLNEALEEER